METYLEAGLIVFLVRMPTRQEEIVALWISRDGTQILAVALAVCMGDGFWQKAKPELPLPNRLQSYLYGRGDKGGGLWHY